MEEFTDHVEERWQFIRKCAWDGEPVRHLIELLDDDVAFYRERARSGGNETEFNQVLFTHLHYKTWIEKTISDRQHFVDFWRNETEFQYSKMVDSANESRKLVILVHGAALLGSLTALGALQNNQYESSFLAVAIGSLVAMCVAIVGQIIWLEDYGALIQRLRNENVQSAPMLRIRAYSRYWTVRWNKSIWWSIRLTYGSVILFPIYGALAIALAAFSE